MLVGKENATAARNRFGHGDASSAENGALAPKQPGGAGWMLRAGKDAGAATVRAQAVLRVL